MWLFCRAQGHVPVLGVLVSHCGRAAVNGQYQPTTDGTRYVHTSLQYALVRSVVQSTGLARWVLVDESEGVRSSAAVVSSQALLPYSLAERA